MRTILRIRPHQAGYRCPEHSRDEHVEVHAAQFGRAFNVGQKNAESRPWPAFRFRASTAAGAGKQGDAGYAVSQPSLMLLGSAVR
jgi:hypothetical protein